MVIATLGLAAAAYGSKHLFGYNRENFKFDRKQTLQRSELTMKMQIARFQLFRDDIRDLTKLTVDRMDIYHLIGALFLHFTIVLFTKGRIQASTPPFLLALFMLTNACTFIYLLMAVWMSMHASIASHSFGVRLLTRFVRLPIPTVNQINALNYKLADFERQGVGNLLRIPFANQDQHWDAATAADASSSAAAAAAAAPASQRSSGPAAANSTAKAGKSSSSTDELNLVGPAYTASPFAQDSEYAPGGVLPAHLAGIDEEDAEDIFDRAEEEEALREARARPTALLPDSAEKPVGDLDEIMTGAGTQLPERHIQLFRQLQAKWQCYDAYCRVCMGLGTNQMLQALSYYSICHTLVENRSPTSGFALVAILQCTTVALGILDLAGLKEREILVIQSIGVLPCVITAASVSMGQRNEEGKLDPHEVYLSAPLTFLFTVIWLELWLRVAAPSKDRAQLPRRFRQVLFLDVFGDAGGDQYLDKPLLDGKDVVEIEEESERGRQLLIESTAVEAARALKMAVWGLRRWFSIPAWTLSKMQRKQRDDLRKRMSSWGGTLKAEVQRHHWLNVRSVDLAVAGSFDDDIRPLQEMKPEAVTADPFKLWLVGPFNHAGNQEGVEEQYHYSIEEDRPIFDDVFRRDMPDAMVLSMEGMVALQEQLERATRKLLEVRITTDLDSEVQRLSMEMPPTPRTMAREALPNLATLVQDPHAPGMEVPWSDSTHALREAATPAAANDGPSSHPPVVKKDPTAVAMAGENAEHFVPERLPWLLLSRMTRVLQGCWCWASLTFLLSGSEFYKLDFAVGEGEKGIFDDNDMATLGHIGGGRRMEARLGWQFDTVEVSWPHGAFFQATHLACPTAGSDSLVIASPYGTFAGGLNAARPMQLSQLDRHRHSSTGSLLCADWFPSCLYLSLPAEDGRVLRLDAHAKASTESSVDMGGPNHLGSRSFSIQGPAWRAVTGSVLPCSNLSSLPTSLSLSSALPEDQCLLLIGWDGRAFPVSALPLSALDESFAGLPTDVHVTPSLRIPWGAIGNGSREVISMHLDPVASHFWVLVDSGEVQGWDLMQPQAVARWLPGWPRGQVGFRPVAICSTSHEGFFALGVSAKRGAVLARAPLPWGARVQSPLEIMLRRLSEWTNSAAVTTALVDFST